MNSPTTPVDIKQNNYQNIYQLFFFHSQLSKPQIAQHLNLSLPTVVNNLNQLQQEGKIQEQGMLASHGGRPAIAYRLVDDAFIAIGVEIQKKRIKLTALDLKANMLALETHYCEFNHDKVYQQLLCDYIAAFIAQLGYAEERILGIGLSIQGIVHHDHKTVLYSKIIQFDDFDTDYLQAQFTPPVCLFHDVKCAAKMELWNACYINDAFYVSISEHLGGAFILNNKIEKGKSGFSGALEHLQIEAQGEQCYCGQRGCLETYCSLSALLQPHENLADFFKQVRNGEHVALVRWQRYLDYLAKGLKQVYLLLERDIILGGELAAYLQAEDIAYLEQEVKQIYPFPVQDSFIRIAALLEHATVKGAALPFIANYLEPN